MLQAAIVCCPYLYHHVAQQIFILENVDAVSTFCNMKLCARGGGRAVFNWVSKVISCLLWFCISTLCDWLTKLALLFQPMGIQTKTNRVLAARVFPRLAPVTCICFEFWLARFVVYICCDWLSLRDNKSCDYCDKADTLETQHLLRDEVQENVARITRPLAQPCLEHPPGAWTVIGSITLNLSCVIPRL